jgi:hypothetical protein
MDGYRFAAAGAILALVGSGFDGNGWGWDFEEAGDVGLDGVDVGGEFGFFGDNDDIDVADGVSEGFHLVDGESDDGGGIAAEVFGSVGEVVANVAEAEGAEKGIGEGVVEAISIGVGEEALTMGDFNAAKNEALAGNKAVNVVANADSYRCFFIHKILNLPVKPLADKTKQHCLLIKSFSYQTL